MPTKKKTGAKRAQEFIGGSGNPSKNTDLDGGGGKEGVKSPAAAVGSSKKK